MIILGIKGRFNSVKSFERILGHFHFKYDICILHYFLDDNLEGEFDIQCSKNDEDDLVGFASTFGLTVNTLVNKEA